MTALIGIEICLYRHPAGIPYGIAFLDVIITSALVIWNIVITITGQTEKLCILIKAVSSAGIGNQREKSCASQIIDPWKWRLRCGDDVLPIWIIKKTKFHIVLHSAVLRHIVIMLVIKQT